MDITSDSKLELGPESIRYLDKTRKWTMFFAIIGFIFLGMMVIGGIAAGAFLSIFNNSTQGADIPQWIIMVVILLLVLLYFFPVFYLFRFSTHMRNAIQTLNNDELRKAFRNMKSYWVYLGVLVIIMLAFYFIALVVAGASFALLKPLG
jgi:MFS family permease